MTAYTKTIHPTEAIFRPDLYPRRHEGKAQVDEKRVQVYFDSGIAEILAAAPVEVNQDGIIIDGGHRAAAAVKASKLHKNSPGHLIEMPVVVTHTESEADVLELAIKRNATHGYQLTAADKRRNAERMYAANPTDGRKAELAALMGVSPRTMREWLREEGRIKKDARDDVIRQMAAEGKKHTEIAAAVGVSKKTVYNVLNPVEYVEVDERSFVDTGKNGSSAKIADTEAVETAPDVGKNGSSAKIADEEDAEALELTMLPDEGNYGWSEPWLTDRWYVAENSNVQVHPGNSPQEIVEQLLWMYTEEGDVVVDPFAGGGSTGDACVKHGRKAVLSDITPVREGIAQHDVRAGVYSPPDDSWTAVTLAYFDPPYWRQSEGKYEDGDYWAKLDAGDYHEELAAILNAYANKMLAGGHIALLVSPTQWRADNRRMPVYHATEIDAVLRQYGHKRLSLAWQASVPNLWSAYNAQQVEWAKDNRQPLVVNRQLYVWRVV